jgi:hypothetical protein
MTNAKDYDTVGREVKRGMSREGGVNVD